MQCDYRLKIGQDEFLLTVDIQNTLDFFEKLSFYSNLPKVGPNGEDDLKITHRTTTKGYNYYSLVSEKAGMEYKFGQPKEDPKSLYGKGWQPIFKGEQEETQRPSVVQPVTNQFPHVGITPTAPIQAPVFVAPSAQVPSPTPIATQPAQTPQVSQNATHVLARFGLK